MKPKRYSSAESLKHQWCFTAGLQLYIYIYLLKHISKGCNTTLLNLMFFADYCRFCWSSSSRFPQKLGQDLHQIWDIFIVFLIEFNMHSICISYAFHMHFICILYAFYMHFWKVHVFLTKVHVLLSKIHAFLKSAYKVHIKCIWNA